MAQRSFKLPEGLDELLAARAVALDRSVSWVIVKALESALGDGVSRASTVKRTDGPVVPPASTRASAGGFDAQSAALDRQAKLNAARAKGKS